MRKQVSRTAASTSETVISTVPSLLHAIIPELITTGTIVVRNAATDEKVTQPATVAGTPANTGGDLVADHYFAKVVAVDIHGDLSTASTEQDDEVTVGTGSVAYTWTDQANAASWRIYVGLVTNTFDGYFTSATNSFTLTQVATPDVVIAPAADTSAATTGDTQLRVKCAVTLPQAGKQLGGIVMERGITVQLSAATDLTQVVWEPL